MKTRVARPCARCKAQSPKDLVDGQFLCVACRAHFAEWAADVETINAYRKRRDAHAP